MWYGRTAPLSGRLMALRRYSGAAMGYIVRPARTRDVPEIRALIDENVGSRRLLDKHTVNLYEDILEFSVSESSDGGAVVGCGALHVMWDDLAELRTVAVHQSMRGAGIGHLIVDDLLDRARRVGRTTQIAKPQVAPLALPACQAALGQTTTLGGATGGIPVPTPQALNSPDLSLPDNVGLNFRTSYVHQFNLQIQKQFGALFALDDVSIDFNAREVVALLGDNGAGKSTLIKVISGTYVPDGGEMFLAGKKVAFA